MTRIVRKSFAFLVPAACVAAMLGCGRAQPDVAAEVRSGSQVSRGSTPVPLGARVDTDALPVEATGGVPPSDEGIGPGMGGDQHDVIDDNPFLLTEQSPLSTFSVDVDTASYAKVRSYLIGQGRLPRKDAVRIEELVNYFDYDYQAPQPTDPHPFVTDVALSECPWNPEHYLARIAIAGVEGQDATGRASNLVFLIDVSGSMKAANKLPLLQKSMALLVEQLGENDRISMVVYAGAAGTVLDGASGDEGERIQHALRSLTAGGSTNGGAGIRQAYALAKDHFIPGGTNRVILCSDGDFNVGTTGTDQLVRLVEEQAKGNVFLTILGFGMGNHNDAMLEQISGRGNGNYYFIDTIREARKVLVHDIHSTMTTIAKDVKIQVEMNPRKVAAYRLIGYENRILASEEFNDDAKDAGEIGAGHTVTALYEIVPQGAPLPSSAATVDPLRYQQTKAVLGEDRGDEWMAIKLRYKRPDEDISQKVELVVREEASPFDQADPDLQFAAAVASFGMLLRESPHRGSSNMNDVLRIAERNLGDDPHGFRAEFCAMVRVAQEL